MNSPSTFSGGRRGSFSETKYIYNKSRTGPYPARNVSRQQRSLTFNETFRALFPAVFAVLLSLMVLSAFNHLHGNKVIEWINDNAISIPGYRKHSTTDLMERPTTEIMKIDGVGKPPFDLAEYEKLGPKTSGSYWANKGRGQEYQNMKNRKIDYKSMINTKYQSYGPFASSSYYENIGKMKEYEDRKISNQFN
ncbi:hypothetical protein DDB_G0273273 [Dictyostelium discoideum AX4]|uniref:Uncharacterized protein n=1 Tax=Dictyostelium discoideum TaxID=44689 RepID=Q556T1_DICDI|nr:hypothetical protein DDB_G0273843 [Dictyostelium discoideum AX4]XP_644712.1 hypothetical protein DDB_G0273273 [Dictyostelium discoideum AX4]EAL70612.1 hypothetical protein DDB_G0273843 [Dictyostelium discoideum AX4]EAL70854.1 hypothetical protein DDB_G0273273 [Dictyostelium discoideum AX4]|eukprot:XP_644538.1 hypothetical protein DDB_G0273843 [Dictyostelium discoideum AX4]